MAGIPVQPPLQEACLCVFEMKKKIRQYSSIQTKLQLSFAALAIAISALLTLSLFAITRHQMRQDVRSRLRDVVNVATLQIDADLHSTLIDPAQENGPDYIKIKNTLQQIRNSGDDFRFVYTWRLNDKGQLVFVVDAETDPEEISHLGDIYDAEETILLLGSTPKKLVDFQAGKACFTFNAKYLES
jgi:hypothetical protein